MAAATPQGQLLQQDQQLHMAAGLSVAGWMGWVGVEWGFTVLLECTLFGVIKCVISPPFGRTYVCVGFLRQQQLKKNMDGVITGRPPVCMCAIPLTATLWGSD